MERASIWRRACTILHLSALLWRGVLLARGELAAAAAGGWLARCVMS